MTDRKLLDQEELPSRRSFLGASVTVVAAVAATTIPVTNAIAATMVTKAFANHQDYAIGSHHCALCVHFRMPHSCEVVSGKINPNGVCRFFKAKAALTLKWSIAAAREKLFVFVTRRDVPATNNVSERALRPSVIFRKVTNGFRSAWGADVYADIRSIVATGQLQGRTALAAITEALATGHVATV